MERITLVGYLGGDASLISINGEDRFYRASIAPVRRRKDEDKANDGSLLWYNLCLPLGLKNLIPHLLKGTMVAVNGWPRITAYNDKSGQACPNCSIYVDTIELLGRGERSNATNNGTIPNASGAATVTPTPEPTPMPPTAPQNNGTDEELPF